MKMSKNFKKVIELIKNWFYSDLDIEIKIKKGKKKGFLILESDCYYFEGKRFKGNHRRFIFDGDDEIYKQLEKFDIFNKDFNLDATLDTIYMLKYNGFTLS